MASEAVQSAIADIIVSVFGSDTEAFRTALAEIKANTEAVTLQNKIAELRKQQKAAHDEIESQIQALILKQQEPEAEQVAIK